MHYLNDGMRKREGIVSGKTAGGIGASFEELLAPYRRRMRLYIGKTLSNPEDVRDVESETLARASAKIADCASGEAFGPWLFGICRNVLREQYRADRRASRLIEKLGALRDVAPFELSPEELLLAGEDNRKRAVLDLLDELSEGQRRIVMLVLLSGFSRDEAAEAMNLSPDAARMLLGRAVIALRKRLIERGEIDD